MEWVVKGVRCRKGVNKMLSKGNGDVKGKFLNSPLRRKMGMVRGAKGSRGMG
jgi:hypothetical protein